MVGALLCLSSISSFMVGALWPAGFVPLTTLASLTLPQPNFSLTHFLIPLHSITVTNGLKADRTMLKLVITNPAASPALVVLYVPSEFFCSNLLHNTFMIHPKVWSRVALFMIRIVMHPLLRELKWAEPRFLTISKPVR